jgi:nucleotidyltransferase/DNA polymerase involved in DNA repair
LTDETGLHIIYKNTLILMHMKGLNTLCIRASGFALSALQAPQGRPAVVLHEGRVVEANARAQSFGVSRFMPQSAVSAVCPHALCLQEDVIATQQLYEQWMQRCSRLALATEPIDSHTVLLDWRGFEDGGRQAWRTLCSESQRMGVTLTAGFSAGRVSAQVAMRAAERKGLRLKILKPPLLLSLWSLPLQLLPAEYEGVVQRCLRIGWTSFGTLASQPIEQVRTLLGENGLSVWYLAQGYDSPHVRALYPPPHWQTGGEFADTITEEAVQALWKRVARELAAKASQCGQGIAEIRLTLTHEGSKRQNLHRSLPAPLCDERAIYAQINRLWQMRAPFPPPVRWQLRAVWSTASRPIQFDLESSAAHRGDLQAALAYLRRRFGEEACFPLAHLETSWNERMRRYYEACNLSAYSSGADERWTPLSHQV